MSKSGYTGPLEQVGPCQWQIPKSYRDDMRVDGLIFADEHADRADQARTRGPSRWPTSPPCPASRRPAWRCPTSTGATASPSAASPRPTPRRGA